MTSWGPRKRNLTTTMLDEVKRLNQYLETTPSNIRVIVTTIDIDAYNKNKNIANDVAMYIAGEIDKIPSL